MIHKAFFPGDIPCKTTDTIVNGDDVRVKAADEVVQSTQRRNFAAGGNVEIYPKGGDFIVRMALPEMCVQ